MPDPYMQLSRGTRATAPAPAGRLRRHEDAALLSALPRLSVAPPDELARGRWRADTVDRRESRTVEVIGRLVRMVDSVCVCVGRVDRTTTISSRETRPNATSWARSRGPDSSNCRTGGVGRRAPPARLLSSRRIGIFAAGRSSPLRPPSRWSWTGRAALTFIKLEVRPSVRILNPAAEHWLRPSWPRARRSCSRLVVPWRPSLDGLCRFRLMLLECEPTTSDAADSG